MIIARDRFSVPAFGSGRPAFPYLRRLRFASLSAPTELQLLSRPDRPPEPDFTAAAPRDARGADGTSARLSTIIVR